MRFLLPASLLAATILIGPAFAQKAGPNGGQTVVADGHPIELVATDAQLTFFVLGEDGKPLDTAGLSAKAYVQTAGKTATVSLTPEAPNKFTGALPAPLAKGIKVVLSTKLHGHGVQARFEK